MTSAPGDVESTVLDLLNEFIPDGWRPEDLLDWPPDLFAFTSYLLERTGIYRYVVGSPLDWAPSQLPNWTDTIEKASAEWHKSIVSQRVRRAPRMGAATGARPPCSSSAM